jgi:hypothetical protein
MTGFWARAVGLVAAGALGAATLLPIHAGAYPAGTVFLQTVPALPGVSLSIDGAQVRTDPSGAASTSISNINGVAARVSLASRYVDSATSVAIDRVVTGPHVPHESHLFVGLNVTSRVSIGLSSAAPTLSVGNVNRLQLHSVTGDSKTIDPAKRRVVHLLSRRSQFQHGVLVAQKVTWSVHGDYVGGSAAVTSAQARFDPLTHRQWAMKLTTVHGTVQIDTVPRVPGVTFLLDGTAATTGANGSVVVPVNDLNNVDARVQLESHQAGNVQVSHVRVRKMPPPGIQMRRVVVALDVWRPVKFSFIDHRGQSVPISRISSVEISADNSLVNLTGTQLRSDTPLLAQTTNYVGSHWRSRPVTYSMIAARVDGSNAVFTGTQRFQPLNGGSWQVTLALFTLTVVTRDALFGSTVSSPAVLVRPDGSRADVRLGGDSDNRIPSVVRGLYTLELTAAAIGSRTTVLVSRDDAITLRVVTMTDALVVVGVFVLLLASMVFGGVLVARRRAQTETRCHRDTSVQPVRWRGGRGGDGRHRAIRIGAVRFGGAQQRRRDDGTAVGRRREGSRLRLLLPVVHKVFLASRQDGLSSGGDLQQRQPTRAPAPDRSGEIGRHQRVPDLVEEHS